VLQCVAVCCSVLQSVAVITHSQTNVNPKSIQDPLCCSVSQCVAVRCSVFSSQLTTVNPKLIQNPVERNQTNNAFLLPDSFEK